MRLNSGGLLTYCMNVHPGETREEVLQAVRTHIPKVKKALSLHDAFGVGLRLAGKACEASCGREQVLKEALDQAGAFAFTVNAFPHGAFHDTRVKETVYLPDWANPERVRYTLNAAGILARLLPEGVEGSVSTVPLGYKYGALAKDPASAEKAFFAHLTQTALGLHRLYQETGRFLHVGLEPEPDCLLETTDETLRFFDRLFQQPEQEILRRHIGVCIDTCHVAMQFEDPAQALQRIREADIRISKVQLSAALEADAARISAKDLRRFDDGVYFHQTTSSSGKRWRDLPDWFSRPDTEAGRLRIHCHIPLDWQGDTRLGSTRHTLSPAFWQELNSLDRPHLEVETYTFGVLPREVSRNKTVELSMADELRWVLSKLG